MTLYELLNELNDTMKLRHPTHTERPWGPSFVGFKAFLERSAEVFLTSPRSTSFISFSSLFVHSASCETRWEKKELECVKRLKYQSKFVLFFINVINFILKEQLTSVVLFARENLFFANKFRSLSFDIVAALLYWLLVQEGHLIFFIWKYINNRYTWKYININNKYTWKYININIKYTWKYINNKYANSQYAH